MSAPTDVYVADAHPHYPVMVDGAVYTTLTVLNGHPLTWSEQWDVADNFRQSLTEWPTRSDAS